MVTTAPVTATRVSTPARWASALDRAAARGITVAQDPGTGVFTAPSSDGSRHYVVSWYGCECAAAQGGDPVCLHRAAFRQHCRDEDRQIARMLREAIDVEPTFSAEHHRMCTDCLDTGWTRMHLSGRLNDYTEAPCSCATGQAVRTPSVHAA